MFTTKTPTVTQMLPLGLRTEFFRRVYFHRPARSRKQWSMFDAWLIRQYWNKRPSA